MLPGVAAPMLAAPAPLALAWKLLWLATDTYPQGKDLYDAVLLAENTTVGPGPGPPAHATGTAFEAAASSPRPC